MTTAEALNPLALYRWYKRKRAVRKMCNNGHFFLFLSSFIVCSSLLLLFRCVKPPSSTWTTMWSSSHFPRPFSRRYCSSFCRLLSSSRERSRYRGTQWLVSFLLFFSFFPPWTWSLFLEAFRYPTGSLVILIADEQLAGIRYHPQQFWSSTVKLTTFIFYLKKKIRAYWTFIFKKMELTV